IGRACPSPRNPPFWRPAPDGRSSRAWREAAARLALKSQANSTEMGVSNNRPLRRRLTRGGFERQPQQPEDAQAGGGGGQQVPRPGTQLVQQGGAGGLP